MSIKARLLQIGFASIAAGILVFTFEGEVRQPYADTGGVKTVCIGHTGKDIKNKLYSEQECTALFVRDLIAAERAVERCTPRVSGSAKEAFTSFVFNVGESAYCKSRLAQMANTGNILGACDMLLQWRFDNGKEVKGLLNRRKAERAVCQRDYK